MLNFLKRISFYLTLIATIFVISTYPVLAVTPIGDQVTAGATAAVNNAYGTVVQQDLPTALIKIINFLLTFLAVIFLLGVIYAGLLWMNARGNDQLTTKAKTMLTELVIGLLIVVLARIITEGILTIIGQAV
jgi:hypothetical protein